MGNFLGFSWPWSWTRHAAALHGCTGSSGVSINHTQMLVSNIWQTESESDVPTGNGKHLACERGFADHWLIRCEHIQPLRYSCSNLAGKISPQIQPKTSPYWLPKQRIIGSSGIYNLPQRHLEGSPPVHAIYLGRIGDPCRSP